MDCVIIILLILLIFLISCDTELMEKIKSMLSSSYSSDSEEDEDEDTHRRSNKTSSEPFYNRVYSRGGRKSKFKGKFPVRKSKFMNNSEAPSTWEPSEFNYEQQGPDMYKAYAEDLKANVDQAIIESHQAYMADMEFTATMGASHASANDFDDSPVPWVGIKRGGDVQHDGVEETARVTTSYTPEHIEDLKRRGQSGMKWG